MSAFKGKANNINSSSIILKSWNPGIFLKMLRKKYFVVV
jgi:hypothetical protein